MTTSADVALVSRWCSTAATWVSKATWALRARHEEASLTVQPVFEWEADRLLAVLLDHAAELVPLMPADGDLLEDRERAARDLWHLLRDRRRQPLLANVSGRTPEEAKTFRDHPLTR